MNDLFLEIFFATRHRHTKSKHNPSGRSLVSMYTGCTECTEASFLHKKLHSWHMDYSTAVGRGGGCNYLVPVGWTRMFTQCGSALSWTAHSGHCCHPQNTSSCKSPLNSGLDMIYKFKHPPIRSHCCIMEHTHIHTAGQIHGIKYLHCCHDSRVEIALREVEAFWDKSP